MSTTGGFTSICLVPEAGDNVGVVPRLWHKTTGGKSTSGENKALDMAQDMAGLHITMIAIFGDSSWCDRFLHSILWPETTGCLYHLLCNEPLVCRCSPGSDQS